MTELIDKDFRRISRDFKGQIELTKKTPQSELTKIFFEMCDFGLNNYIEAEKKKNPNKSIKDIVINMYEFHEKLKTRRRILWKLYIKMPLNK